jgi:hypothetical protein
MRRHRSHRARIWWEVGLVLAVVVTTVAVLLIHGLSPRPLTPGSPTAPTEPSVSPATPTSPATTGPVLVVKIDNAAAARPATGLASASVVYVEPVEGGLTRLVAVYPGAPPAVIGPVRSARHTDIELLGQYGTPVLAYSGAAPELLPALRAANLINASPAEAPGAFHRDSGRPAPHNLYVRPRALPGGAKAPAEPVLAFGAAPATGTSAARLDIAFRSARFGFTWSAAANRWLVWMDGTPLVSTESGQLGAATVIEQRVEVTTAESADDVAGQASPVVRTVGHGDAVVLRDGRRFDATWTRPAASAPTRFHTTDGGPFPLAPGPVWILLVPA